MLHKIISCFKDNKVLYSNHAKQEMEIEPLGEIREEEVSEAILNGKVIEDYDDDEPYPSCLIYGRTRNNRPIHIVCAYADSIALSIVITVYEPSPEKWIDYERRR